MALLRENEKLIHTPEDICAHLGDNYEDWLGAVNPPIYQTTLFTATSKPSGFVYTRVSNPTTEVAERKIAALEGADGALCFGSGMAAITSAINHFVKANCHIIVVNTAYCDARRYITDYLAKKSGVTYTYVLGDDIKEIEAAIRPETTLIYLESPSSAILRMQDLEAIAKLAKAHGIGTAIDNTYATPLYQQPLKWGIDISIHTVSKYLCGHSAVVGGVLCAREEIIRSIQDNERALLGSLLSPMDSYLLCMSLRTLPIRMAKHGENGRKVAEFLENHPKVERVFYPGSKTYPWKELFDKYMTGTTGLVSVVPKGSKEEVENFCHSLKGFLQGVSWGSYESIVSGKSVGMTEERARAEGMVPNIVRLNIGTENIETTLKNLDEALNACIK